MTYTLEFHDIKGNEEMNIRVDSSGTVEYAEIWSELFQKMIDCTAEIRRLQQVNERVFALIEARFMTEVSQRRIANRDRKDRLDSDAC